jgi:hypothetical protein
MLPLSALRIFVVHLSMEAIHTLLSDLAIHHPVVLHSEIDCPAHPPDYVSDSLIAKTVFTRGPSKVHLSCVALAGVLALSQMWLVQVHCSVHIGRRAMRD